MSKKKKVEVQEDVSPYPQLSDAIEKLQSLAPEASETRRVLLEKWLERLITTEKEMRHLERIESLATALTERESETE